MNSGMGPSSAACSAVPSHRVMVNAVNVVRVHGRLLISDPEDMSSKAQTNKKE